MIISSSPPPVVLTPRASEYDEESIKSLTQLNSRISKRINAALKKGGI